MKTLFLSLLCSSIMLLSQAQQRQMRVPGLESKLLHKDYRPQSVFKTPQTKVLKAKYPAIDMHMHAPEGGNLDSAATELLKNMDACGIEKTVLFCRIGKTFDQNAAAFGKYPDRIQLWCWLDLTGYDKPGFGPSTIAELERCVKLGAKGVGEVHDKGNGLPGAPGMHIDDPRMDPILEKMADLNLPFNFHWSDPIWMFEPMDEHNDLLFESLYYRLDNKPDFLHQPALLVTLENALKKHPRTNFIAAHLLNHTHNLDELGRMFDKYPNLYADVSQRESYVAAVPRYAKQFIEKYADRLVYGTDQGWGLSMYRHTFHIWETLDEHFYAWDVSNTPWSLSGLGLNDVTLKKLYRENALRILKK